jgi:DNA-binding transcriptional MerR regulator
MITVTKLARACGLSRSTVLYYESIGLLRPAGRSAGNYRRYGEKDLARLRQICVYREAGLKLADIQALLDRQATDAAAVLERRLVELNGEIGRLRGHQQAILKLLTKAKSLGRIEMLTKEKFVTVLRGAGLSEEEMRRFHAEFEKSAPAEHQEFLEFLHIPAEEIQQIREHSRPKD